MKTVNTENLDKVQDAFVDWENPFDKPEYLVDPNKFLVKIDKEYMVIKNMVTLNGRSYYVTEGGFLWPV